MPTKRAEGIAEMLWRLKRAGKLATWREISKRAGFRTGKTGKTFEKCLAAVRRDWPHLQWWRAVRENGVVEKGSEREELLRKSGFELEPLSDESDRMVVKDFEEHEMDWNENLASARA